MREIEIAALRCLEAAVRLGSLSAAARALGVSQPAVSVQIAGLEKRLGAILLERRARGVTATPAGEAIMERARGILDSVSALEGGLDRGPLRGTLRFGSTDVVVLHRLPPVLRRFRARHPEVELRLRIEGSAALAEGVRARELEFALVTLPLPDPPGTITPLYRDRLCFVASPGHALSTGRAFTLRRIAAAPLLGHKAGSITRGLIDAYFNARGLVPRMAMEISSPEVLRRMARSGLGVAILPEVSVQDEVRRGQLTILNVRGWNLERISGLLVPQAGPSSRAARVFLDLLQGSRQLGRARGTD